MKEIIQNLDQRNSSCFLGYKNDHKTRYIRFVGFSKQRTDSVVYLTIKEPVNASFILDSNLGIEIQQNITGFSPYHAKAQLMEYKNETLVQHSDMFVVMLKDSLSQEDAPEEITPDAEYFYEEMKDLADDLEAKKQSGYWKGEKGDKGDTYTITDSDYDAIATKTVTKVQPTLNQKVDKVEGKQLSTNDYTNVEKSKLSSLENYDDTAIKGRVKAIEDDYLKGSDKTSLENSIATKVDKVSGKSLILDTEIQRLSTLHNYDDSALQSKIEAIESDYLTSQDKTSLENEIASHHDNSKVDKVDGKGLSTNDYTNTEKTKLSGIETGANKYVLPSDVPHDSSYVHTDNNYTTSEKQKLSGIEAQANKTIVDSELSDTSTNPVQNKVVKGAVTELNNALANKANQTEVTELKEDLVELDNTVGETPASDEVGLELLSQLKEHANKIGGVVDLIAELPSDEVGVEILSQLKEKTKLIIEIANNIEEV